MPLRARPNNRMSRRIPINYIPRKLELGGGLIGRLELVEVGIDASLVLGSQTRAIRSRPFRTAHEPEDARELTAGLPRQLREGALAIIVIGDVVPAVDNAAHELQLGREGNGGAQPGMVEGDAILEAEAAGVVVVTAALDDFRAEGSDKDTGVKDDVMVFDRQRFGEVELLDGLPTARAAGFGGMNKTRGVAEGEGGGEAQRKAFAFSAGNVELTEAEAQITVVDVEGTAGIVDADLLAAWGEDAGEGRGCCLLPLRCCLST